MNITINIYGDIYADICDCGCPCGSYDDYEDECDDLCDECQSHAEDTEADDCVFGRIKKDFSNIDELAQSAPPDIYLAIACQIVKMFIELQHEVSEALHE